MGMRDRTVGVVTASVVLASVVLVGTASPGASALPRADAPPAAGPPITVTVAHPDRCSVLASRGCLYPFPNDEFTVASRATSTGRLVHLATESTPANTSGVHVDTAEWNRNDGFSPGAAIVAYLSHVDLKASGATPITDIGASLSDPDAGVVVIDAATGERHPLWAEIDLRSKEEGGEKDPATIVRPAVNWAEGHRYIVAFRHMRNTAGGAVAPTAVFRAYRDNRPTGNAAVEARRAHMEQLFATLGDAGIGRRDLTLAWDFTVASQTNLSARVLAMRNDAMRSLGKDGAPKFTIVPTPADDTTDDDAHVVEGTFVVPKYLTGTGAPGSRLTRDAKGLPKRNGTYTATFTCVVPNRRNGPSQAVVYGHGLLGSQDEVLGFGGYASRHNSVVCAADWIGLAEEDIGNAVAILGDLSHMPSMPDRVQQSFVNFQYLARLMKSPKGLVTKVPGIATGNVAYWGRSQGGIFGGGATAISTEWTRAVLGEPGMNYSTLLERSVDFDDYAKIQTKAYPHTLDWPILLGLMQMLWDRGEANGYAAHITDHPLPGTPKHTVMLFEAYGDHQVTNVATEVEARTIGAKLKEPSLAPGRTPYKVPFWGIEPFGPLPGDGSVLYPWDFGTPTPPTGNLPNRQGDDPHDMDSDTPEAMDVVAAFLAPNGQVRDYCGALPCTAPPHDGF